MEELSRRGAEDGVEGFLEQLPCAAVVERDGSIVARNGMARRISGWGSGAGEPVALGELLPGVEAAPGGAERVRLEAMLVRRYGPPVPVHVAAQPAVFEGRSCRLLLVMEGEGGAERGRSTGLLVEDVLDALPEAIAITNRKVVVHVNAEFTRLFGLMAEECVGREIGDLIVPEGRQHEREMMVHMLRTTGRGEMETVRRTRWGEMLDVSMRVVEVKLGGDAVGVLATYRDIRMQKLERARLTHSARHDALTGLANRAQFLERVQSMLERLQRRPDREFAVIFLDLDGFKRVNDRLGHAAGDELLVKVAERLTRCLRPQDSVARFGGDEFALLLDESGGLDKVVRVLERIQREIGRPVELGAGTAQVGASMGVVIAMPGHGGAEAILRDADGAMYEAKAQGKGRHVLARECTTMAQEAVLGSLHGGCEASEYEEREA